MRDTDKKNRCPARPKRSAFLHVRHLLTGVFLSALIAAPLPATGDTLTSKELASNCVKLKSEPSSVDSLFCIRYIQGFIDGAVATDARVLRSAENQAHEEESFAERAMRTRATSRFEHGRDAQFSGYCLGSPIPSQHILKLVVRDLLDTPATRGSVPARETVYASLRKHYPCQP